MPRYVLLEFDDVGQAEAFVRSIQDANERNSVSVAYMTRRPESDDEYCVSYVDKGLRAEAMWARPTKFCECNTVGGEESRGKKYGWLVHTSCGRPIRNRVHHPTNLLDSNPPQYPGASGLYLGLREPRTKD